MSMELRIGGKSYDGAKSGSLNLNIDSVANSFSALVTNFWATSITEIKAGDSVEVYMEGSKRFTGWIDRASPDIGGQGNLVNISGRSKSGDIIDCTPDVTQSEFKNQTFESLVLALVAPFGLTVKANVSTGEVIESANYDQGESIFEFLKKEAIKKGLLMYSDTSGNLVIDKAGTTSSGLIFKEGENILSCNARVDYSNRFSKYIVKGDQQSNPYVDEEAATNPMAIATDEEIRYRPLIIMVSGKATDAICEQRAKWEAAIRIGKSVTYSVTLQGWYFNLNETCTLQSNRIGANESLLISKITNSFSESGKICTMELVRPITFSELPKLKVEKQKKVNPYLNLGAEDLSV